MLPAPNNPRRHRHPFLSPSLCAASAPGGTAACHLRSFLPDAESRKTHPENRSLPGCCPWVCRSRHGTFLPVHNLRMDCPALRSSRKAGMPLLHPGPRPAPGGISPQGNTAHTYGLPQPPGTASLPPFHSPAQRQGRRHTFSRYGIAGRRVSVPLLPFLPHGKPAALWRTIPAPHPGRHPVQGRPHTSCPGHTLPGRSLPPPPAKTGCGPVQSPARHSLIRRDTAWPACSPLSTPHKRSGCRQIPPFCLHPPWASQGHPPETAHGCPPETNQGCPLETNQGHLPETDRHCFPHPAAPPRPGTGFLVLPAMPHPQRETGRCPA